MEEQQLIELTADIVAAHVANNRVAVSDIGQLVASVHTALASLGAPAEPAQEAQASPTPAVSIRSSVKPDYLVCLACGRKQKTLKRHLTTAPDLEPQEYRTQYDLPRDYPMVAPDYAEQRRQMAHAIGLGRKGNAKRPRVRSASQPGSPGRGKQPKWAYPDTLIHWLMAPPSRDREGLGCARAA